MNHHESESCDVAYQAARFSSGTASVGDLRLPRLHASPRNCAVDFSTSHDSDFMHIHGSFFFVLGSAFFFFFFFVCLFHAHPMLGPHRCIN